MSQNFDQALASLTQVLGSTNVLRDLDTLERMATNAEGLIYELSAVLRPEREAQVSAIVKIANQFQLTLYPISIGHNWGYGTSLPASKDCVLLDLSQMNSIVEFNTELDYVTVEPGVSFDDLYKYVRQNNLPYIVPVSGAGPNTSVLGNAIERGYGIAPINDHFAAVTSLRAVLPDASIYVPTLASKSSTQVDAVFKWGLGPYLDGLFTQGNLGVVTQVTISLQRRPERVSGFVFSVKDNVDLGEAVEAVRTIMRDLPGVVSSANLLNDLRVVAKFEPYPFDKVDPGGTIPLEVLASFRRKHQVTHWSGIGALYGTKAVVRAAKSHIKKQLKPICSKLVFITPEQSARAARFSGIAKRLGFFKTAELITTVNRALQNFSGEPNEVSLPFCYWRGGKMPAKGQPMDPARDGCGLLWYSPLVPMTPSAVSEYCSFVEETCRKHGIEPLITLTAFSPGCFDSTVPVLFDPSISGQKEAAHQCYEELLNAGADKGFYPYRLGVYAFKHFYENSCSGLELASRIKQTLDPRGVLAPGRYVPTVRSTEEIDN